VETNEDTDDEAGDGDAVTGPDVGVAPKPRRRTRSAVGKQSASAVAAAVSAVKDVEKKKRKRKVTSPPAVVMITILTPRSREVESEEEEEERENGEAIKVLLVTEDRPTRRSESPAAKRQRELVENTSKDALRWSLEALQTVAATQAKMPTAVRPRVFRLKLRIPISVR
jgi:hypothetical protein